MAGKCIKNKPKFESLNSYTIKIKIFKKEFSFVRDLNVKTMKVQILNYNFGKQKILINLGWATLDTNSAILSFRFCFVIFEAKSVINLKFLHLKIFFFSRLKYKNHKNSGLFFSIFFFFS